MTPYKNCNRSSFLLTQPRGLENSGTNSRRPLIFSLVQSIGNREILGSAIINKLVELVAAYKCILESPPTRKSDRIRTHTLQRCMLSGSDSAMSVHTIRGGSLGRTPFLAVEPSAVHINRAMLPLPRKPKILPWIRPRATLTGLSVILRRYLQNRTKRSKQHNCLGRHVKTCPAAPPYS